VAQPPFAGYIGSPGGQPDDQSSPVPPTATAAPTETPAPTTEPTVEPTPTVTETPAPTPTETPMPVEPVVLTNLHARYWANDHLDGLPAVERPEPVLDLNWGAGSPDPTLPDDGWSAVYTTEWTGPISAFVVRSDDGFQVYVDDQLIVERWQSAAYSTERFLTSIPAGDHTIRVTYNERTGDARLRVAVQP
jgi:hypothetical protein